MIPSKKEIDMFKVKFEEIYSNVQTTLMLVSNEHPELNRLKARVDELLAENTRLVLENREYKQREQTLDEMLDNSCLCVTDGSVYQKVADLMFTAQLKGAEESGVQEAIQVLFKALGWSSGGLGSAAIEIVKQRDGAREELQEWVNDCFCQQDSIKFPDGCGRCHDSRGLLGLSNQNEED